MGRQRVQLGPAPPLLALSVDAVTGAAVVEGQRVELRPKSSEVLKYLLDHPERVVSKSELLDAVWPGCAVTDDSLVQCIVEIRRAIRGDHHVQLRTMPKRGYRLNVSRSKTPHARWHHALLSAVLTHTRKLRRRPVVPQILVLPFQTRTMEEDTTLLMLSVTDAIISELSRRPGLGVRTVEGTQTGVSDPLLLGRAAGVDFVVEGNLRMACHKIRLVAHLIRVEDGAYLWAETFDAMCEDAFKLEDQISRKLVDRALIELERGIMPGPAESDS